MKKFITLALSALFIIICYSCEMQNNGHTHGPADHSHGTEEHSHSHGSKTHSHGSAKIQHAFSYLSMNGEFKMNPGDSITQNDPRNLGKIVLSTDTKKGTVTKMAFYDHNDLNKLLAECGYQFIGSRPDPHYFPEESKTSIWDVFKKSEDYEGDCTQFEYVISRSPHGDPIHMHLRYGDNLEQLLENSNLETDNNFNPWWATYCALDQKEPCG